MARDSWSCWALLALFVGASTTRADAPTSESEPMLREDGTVRIRAEGEFRSNQNAARESALHAAQDQMRAWLARQDPPIRRAPSLDLINREMVRQQETPQEETIGRDKMYKMTLVVELSPSHVRDLRERDRAFSGLWALGAVLAILGVIVLVFRIDEWTKGYLTRWLVAGGLATIVLLAGVWWFAR
jgi:hypothetical protein